jgi:hypothetical protein
MEYENLNLIAQKIGKGHDVNLIRCEIADLIKGQIEYCELHRCDAALPHLVNAVGSLSLNINSNRQPNTAGLYTALLDLEKAKRALQCEEIQSTFKIKIHWSITYDMLLETVLAIRDKLSTPTERGRDKVSVSAARR